MTWALEGWADYQANGMPVAEAVTAATDRYRQDSDTVARFLADECVRASAARVSLSELFQAFTAWASGDGVDPMPRRQFSTQIEAHGIEKYRSNAGIAFRGLGLAAEETA